MFAVRLLWPAPADCGIAPNSAAVWGIPVFLRANMAASVAGHLGWGTWCREPERLHGAQHRASRNLGSFPFASGEVGRYQTAEALPPQVDRATPTLSDCPTRTDATAASSPPLLLLQPSCRRSSPRNPGQGTTDGWVDDAGGAAFSSWSRVGGGRSGLGGRSSARPARYPAEKAALRASSARVS